MTTRLVAVRPETLFKDVIGLMAEHRISAVPVLDAEDRPIGVVSEADLLNKQEYRGGTEQPQWPEVHQYREKWRKAHAATAGDLMTRPVITVAATDPLVVAARRLTRTGVRRLFVVDIAGRLVGVVARRDLLRPFLRSDEDIRDEVEHELVRGVPCADPSALDIHVEHGVVTLGGHLSRRSQTVIAARLAQAAPGVVEVHNVMRFDIDDIRAPRTPNV